MKKILILGCGWVAEEWAQRLLDRGHQVWATTTQQEKAVRLQRLGIQAVVAHFDDAVGEVLVPKAFDFVLTSIPAASKLDVAQTKSRFEHVSHFLQTISFTSHIYLSSTGIYPDIDGTFDESYDTILNERLVTAERIMSSLDNTVVYRLGGLFGKNRIFAKYFENKVCTTGEQVANFVHVNDVVALIDRGFEYPLDSAIYNIVAPEHPLKEQVIVASAQKYGFQEPAAWEAADSFQKIVDGTRIIRALNYTFEYPNPIDF